MATNYKLIRVFSRESKKSGKVNDYASICVMNESNTDMIDVYIKSEQAEKLRKLVNDVNFDISKFIRVDWDFYNHYYKTILTI